MNEKNEKAKAALPKSKRHSFYYYQTNLYGIIPGFRCYAAGQTKFYQLIPPRRDKVQTLDGIHYYLPAEKLFTWKVFPNQKTSKGFPRRELVQRLQF